MRSKYRPAGKSTREMANQRRRIAIYVGLVIIGIGLILAFLIFNSKALGITGGLYLGILLALKILGDWYEGYNRRSLKKERRATRGAIAEEKIGGLLDGLGNDYYVLNDIGSPFGNIDHIVIGRNNGVFLIETKSHHGKVGIIGDDLLVNGKPPEKNFIGQTLKNTYWLKERIGNLVGLQPWITPILVFTNAFVPLSQPIKNIRIINKKYLVNTIANNGKVSAINNRLWELKEIIANGLIKPNIS